MTRNKDNNIELQNKPRAAEVLYIAHCQVCHEYGIGGAPKHGHEEDWLPRIGKGMSALVNNSVFSFSATSPCPDCSKEELESIIDYMVPTTIPRLVGQSVQYLADMMAQSFGPTQPVEVTQLFWYGCHSCFNFQDHFGQWQATLADNTRVQQIPAVWSPQMATHARAYYTALEFNQANAIHLSLFSNISEARLAYQDAQSIAPIFAQHGIDFDRFIQVFQSDKVRAQVDKAQRLTQQLNKLGMRGVPGLIIDGKYLVQNRDFVSMLLVADTLIQQQQALASSDKDITLLTKQSDNPPFVELNSGARH